MDWGDDLLYWVLGTLVSNALVYAAIAYIYLKAKSMRAEMPR